MTDTIEFFTVMKGNDILVINKHARYQVGMIHSNGGIYTIDDDERGYRCINSAIDELIKQASVIL